MRNIQDWCVSRQLWWGHQIPAWYCEACTPRTSSGALDLEKATPIVARTRPERCPGCKGSALVQDPDVLDTWFSSGLWPFSTLGWPERTPELKTFYPTSVLETGHDILFFWVARMMMLGIHFMGDVPFRTVYLHAMVRDEKGEKMSKVKGNVVDPLDVIHGQKTAELPPSLRNKFPQGMPAFGADALRYTLAALAAQGRDIKLSLDRVNGYKAFTNKLWNASRFLLLYLGDFHPGNRPLRERPLTVADRWILSRTERVTAEVNDALGRYEFAEAASGLYQFTWHAFCDWYIELAKPALQGTDTERGDTTRAVLIHVLDRVLRLLHPFIPFITEEIWHRLPGVPQDAFLMLAAFPAAGTEDPAAEAEMAPVIAVVEGIRNIRGESNLPPLQRIRAVVQTDDAALRPALERHRSDMESLAGLSEMTVQPTGAPPPSSASWVGQGVSVYVPLAGLLDLDEERARLRKEIARVESDLAALRRKLDNPSFVARAPADVVEKDRARVTELEARRAKLLDNLSRI
jgi:valyl-tRNA synthetase